MTERETDQSREQGIEFNELDEVLENEEYPISLEELLERHGDHELKLPDGTVTLEEIIGIADEQEFEDKAAVRESVFNLIGDDAVGRKGYTDRGGAAGNENDQQSF